GAANGTYDVTYTQGQATETVALTISTGLPANLTSNVTTPTSLSAGSTLDVMFTLTDSNGNPISGQSVTWNTSNSLNPADLTVVTGTTNAYGQVSATYKDTVAGDTGRIVATLNSNTNVTGETGTITVVPAAIASAATVLDPSQGGPQLGYHSTQGYWLNSEVQNGSSTAHAMQVTLKDAYGNLVSGSYTLTAASNFLISTSDAGPFGSTATVTFTNGVGIVFVENSSTYTGDLATGVGAEGSIANGTTIATTSNAVDINTASGVSTYVNLANGTYIAASGTSVSAANGVTLAFSGSGLQPAATSGSTNYYYFQIAEVQPGSSEGFTLKIGVPYGDTPVTSANVAPNGTITLYNGTTAITSGDSGTLTSGAAFTPTKGYIYSFGESTTGTSYTELGNVRAGS
ncbi:MAG: Ig-like domain-containing protein, partial [Firmicutes bacterium]|nr:Ig-like domain-containing protein [Bacillota bacterium]